MNKYKHLTLFERETVNQLLIQKKSLTDIAKAMGRDKSTLSREISRTRLTRYGYRAFTAQVLSQQRQGVPKKQKRLKTMKYLKNISTPV